MDIFEQFSIWNTKENYIFNIIYILVHLLLDNKSFSKITKCKNNKVDILNYSSM